MSHRPAPPSVEAAIQRLLGGDPLAAVLLHDAAAAHGDRYEVFAALALLDTIDSADPGYAEDRRETIERAERIAPDRRARQHVAIVAAFTAGEAERARLLARQHLAEFPGDVVVSWIAARC